MEEEVIVQAPNLFKSFLDHLVQLVYLIHRYILSINDGYEMGLSDKQLHFLVVGALGMFLLFMIYPWVKWLAEKNKLIVVSWIYVFTILIAITLLIEIGQGVSGTGDMDFHDIMAGLLGFIVVSVGYLVLRELYLKIKNKDNSNNKQQ